MGTGSDPIGRCDSQTAHNIIHICHEIAMQGGSGSTSYHTHCHGVGWQCRGGAAHRVKCDQGGEGEPKQVERIVIVRRGRYK